MIGTRAILMFVILGYGFCQNPEEIIQLTSQWFDDLFQNLILPIYKHLKNDMILTTLLMMYFIVKITSFFSNPSQKVQNTVNSNIKKEEYSGQLYKLKEQFNQLKQNIDNKDKQSSSYQNLDTQINQQQENLKKIQQSFDTLTKHQRSFQEKLITSQKDLASNIVQLKSEFRSKQKQNKV